MPDPWLWVALTAGTCVLLAALGGQLIRRRGPRLAPVGPYLTGEVIPDGLPGAPGRAVLPETAGAGATGTGGAWRERALAAEELAARSQEAMRESLKPGLLRLLKDKFIRALLQERQSHQETQRLAEAGLAELEARLEKLHAPLTERLDAYERRISELEQQLKARGAENRELIEATIALAKQRLEAERAGKRVTLN
jgi:DNA-binding PadR family transcriptional regulator